MPLPPRRPAQPTAARRWVPVPRCEQVALGDDPGNVPSHGEHRHATDLVLGQPPCDLLVRGYPVDGHHGRRHDISHLAVPPAMALPAGRGAAGPGGRRLLRGLLAKLSGHRVEGTGHVGRCGLAVQRVVIRGAKMAQHGVKVGVPAVHRPPPHDRLGHRCRGCQSHGIKARIVLIGAEVPGMPGRSARCR